MRAPPIIAGQTLIVAPVRSVLRAVESELRSFELRSGGVVADALPYSLFHGGALLGPLIGAPAAVLAAQPFLEGGTKYCVLIGVCGAVQAAAAHGNICIPTQCFRDDGTSERYGAPESFPLPHGVVRKDLVRFCAPGAVFSGGVWSTDTPLLESSPHVQTRAANGVVAIDMECTSLAWICNQMNVDFASVLVVTDVFGEHWEPGFKRKNVRAATEIAAAAVAKFATNSKA